MVTKNDEQSYIKENMSNVRGKPHNREVSEGSGGYFILQGFCF